MSDAPIYLFGAGGMALCCLEIWAAHGERVIVVHEGPVPADRQEEGVSAPQLDYRQVRRAFVAIGDNAKRHRVVGEIRARAPSAEFPLCVHPSVLRGDGARIGAGTYIGAGGVLGPQVEIGEFGVLNAGVIVEHECRIGDYVNIGSGSALGGCARMGDRSVLGVGVAVNHICAIGPDTVVGSGACVVQDLAAGRLALGIPAREVRARKFGDPFL